jgi:urease accessory protein
MSLSSHPTKVGSGAACTVLLLLLPQTSTFAHHAMGGELPATLWDGLLSGFAHPIIGLDHFAFLLAVGLLASATSTPLLSPLLFVGATLCGTAIHLASINLPLAELLVACSVVVVGALLFVRRRLAAVPLVGVFALAGIYHGYAYGESIVGAQQSPLLAYLVGLAAVQYIIAIGVIGGACAPLRPERPTYHPMACA